MVRQREVNLYQWNGFVRPIMCSRSVLLKSKQTSRMIPSQLSPFQLSLHRHLNVLLSISIHVPSCRQGLEAHISWTKRKNQKIKSFLIIVHVPSVICCEGTVVYSYQRPHFGVLAPTTGLSSIQPGLTIICYVPRLRVHPSFVHACAFFGLMILAQFSLIIACLSLKSCLVT